MRRCWTLDGIFTSRDHLLGFRAVIGVTNRYYLEGLLFCRRGTAIRGTRGTDSHQADQEFIYLYIDWAHEVGARAFLQRFSIQAVQNSRDLTPIEVFSMMQCQHKRDLKRE